MSTRRAKRDAVLRWDRGLAVASEVHQAGKLGEEWRMARCYRWTVRARTTVLEQGPRIR
jgi:hypothetical protein